LAHCISQLVWPDPGLPAYPLLRRLLGQTERSSVKPTFRLPVPADRLVDDDGRIHHLQRGIGQFATRLRLR
jgi:hypothetical protein